VGRSQFPEEGGVTACHSSLLWERSGASSDTGLAAEQRQHHVCEMWITKNAVGTHRWYEDGSLRGDTSEAADLISPVPAHLLVHRDADRFTDYADPCLAGAQIPPISRIGAWLRRSKHCKTADHCIHVTSIMRTQAKCLLGLLTTLTCLAGN
jgi:hypothetical protein